jgi:predicted lipoprotein with Yx(FWY)xxD motif
MMKRTDHSHITRAGALAAALLTLAACGSGGGYGGGSSSGYGGGSTATRSGGATTASSGLKVASTSLGKVVVDGRGRTVYLITSDKPGKSLCSASCLSVWPAVPAPAGKARPAGITAPVGHTADTSGGQMATVGGWPVYTFAQDQAPGDVKGQGIRSFGGTWWAVSPSGTAVTGSGSGSGASSGGY